MPVSVKSMFPEGAFGIVGLVVPFAIGALEVMGAQFTLFRGESWRVKFVITFAAPC